MTAIPKDPMILLSFINTQLRDHYSSVEELCQALDVKRTEIDETLTQIDYEYDAAVNRYI